MISASSRYVTVRAYHINTGERIITLVCPPDKFSHPDVQNHLSFLEIIYKQVGWIVYFENKLGADLTADEKAVLQLRFEEISRAG